MARLLVTDEVLADRQHPAGGDVEPPSSRVASRQPGLQLLAPDLLVLLGDEHDRQPAVGDLGSCRDAEALEARPPDGDLAADGVVDQLQRLAQPRSLAGRQRHLERLSLEVELLFTLPDHAAGFDVLLDPLHRLVVPHAVEAFDDLRTAGPEAEHEASVTDVIAARSSHRHQRRCARVDVDDAGADLDPLGLGGEVADLADRVEAVRLGDPHLIEADLFELDHAIDRLFEPAGVIDHHRQLHDVDPPTV